MPNLKKTFSNSVKFIYDHKFETCTAVIELVILGLLPVILKAFNIGDQLIAIIEITTLLVFLIIFIITIIIVQLSHSSPDYAISKVSYEYLAQPKKYTFTEVITYLIKRYKVRCIASELNIQSNNAIELRQTSETLESNLRQVLNEDIDYKKICLRENGRINCYHNRYVFRELNFNEKITLSSVNEMQHKLTSPFFEHSNDIKADELEMIVKIDKNLLPNPPADGYQNSIFTCLNGNVDITNSKQFQLYYENNLVVAELKIKSPKIKQNYVIHWRWKN